MTDRERSGIPWTHDLALRLSILVAALVLSCCVGCVTPTAVPTATPPPFLRFSDWKHQITAPMWTIGDAMEAINSFLEDPLPDGATCIALLAAQVVRIREADAALRGIVPPEECREAHAMLLSGTGDLLLGYEYILKGSQQLDLDLAQQGREYMASAAAKINLFDQMVDAITPGL